MAIIFSKYNKKQIYSLILLGILLLVFTILLIFLLKKKPETFSIKPEAVEAPQINFTNLKSPILMRLNAFANTPDTQEIVGRDNPFSAIPAATATPPKR